MDTLGHNFHSHIYDCQHVFNWTKIKKHLTIIEFINLGNILLYFADITVIAKCVLF